jgi:hypothetical protein
MLTSPTFIHSQRQRILETLDAQHGSSAFSCDYGFVLYRRAERGVDCFGVVTPGGESLPLTARMVQDLALHRCRLRGGTQLALSLPPSVERRAESELDRALVGVRIDFYRAHALRRDTVAVGYVSKARDFRHATVVLMETQPAGWPR